MQIINIAELKRKLLVERPDASEADINKAICDYAEWIEIPSLIRNDSDFGYVLGYLDMPKEQV